MKVWMYLRLVIGLLFRKRLYFILLTTIHRSKVDFPVFCSICLKSGHTKPLVAKWPCCLKDIFIYIYICIYINTGSSRTKDIQIQSHRQFKSAASRSQATRNAKHRCIKPRLFTKRYTQGKIMKNTKEGRQIHNVTHDRMIWTILLVTC